MRRQPNTLSIFVPCQECSQPFHPRSDLLKKGQGKYCSVQCSGVAQRTQVTRCCEICGTSFTTRPSALKRGWGLYCSQSCANRSTTLPPETRYWEFVARRDPGDCWPWTGGCFHRGYGAFTVSTKKTIRAHQFGYMLANGPDSIPSGLFVCHSCDNPSCQNPAHFFLGTTQDNTADRHGKARDARGEGHGMSKLTIDKVREILARYAAGETQTELATAYNVTKNNIHLIVHRKAWKHVE